MGWYEDQKEAEVKLIEATARKMDAHALAVLKTKLWHRTGLALAVTFGAAALVRAIVEAWT
jgi:hypothetical protein